MRFAFIRSENARHSVLMLCRLLRVSKSGYYAWLKRGPSKRSLRDAYLGTMIAAFHVASRGTYGSPRILKDLREAKERTSRKRVARLMRERFLVGEAPKQWRHPAGVATNDPCPPNTLDRKFNVFRRQVFLLSGDGFYEFRFCHFFTSVLTGARNPPIVLTNIARTVGSGLPF